MGADLYAEPCLFWKPIWIARRHARPSRALLLGRACLSTCGSRRVGGDRLATELSRADGRSEPSRDAASTTKRVVPEEAASRALPGWGAASRPPPRRAYGPTPTIQLPESQASTQATPPARHDGKGRPTRPSRTTPHCTAALATSSVLYFSQRIGPVAQCSRDRLPATGGVHAAIKARSTDNEHRKVAPRPA